MASDIKKIVKNGKVFFVKGDNSPLERDFWQSVTENRWENETYQVFDFFVDKNNSYIDIGAWIGPTVLYGCQLARHCYAIEPDPVAFKRLEDNISLNPGLKDKITLFNGCIGDRCGKVKFGTDTLFGDSSSSLLFDKTGSMEVESLTLEEFIRRNDIKDCSFIKIDIEGGEAIVLPDIKKYLQAGMPTLFISLHPYFLKDRKDQLTELADVLRIYPRLYRSDGRVVDPDGLVRLMSSMEKGENFSIIATDSWGVLSRLRYRLTYRFRRLANKLRRLLTIPAQNKNPKTIPLTPHRQKIS